MIIRSARADGEAHTGTVRRPFCSATLMTSRRSDGVLLKPASMAHDVADLTLTICYLPKWLRAQVSCKKEGEGEDVSHAFWGVSVAALGRLVFKIAERM